MERRVSHECAAGNSSVTLLITIIPGIAHPLNTRLTYLMRLFRSNGNPLLFVYKRTLALQPEQIRVSITCCPL